MLIVLVEGPAEKPVIQSLLYTLGFDSKDFRIVVHGGLGELRRKLAKNIAANKKTHPDARFLVLRDNDNGNCRRHKQELQRIIDDAGAGSCSRIRIVCQELEAWLLGDDVAMCAAGANRSTYPAKLRRGDPDTIADPARVASRLLPRLGKIGMAQKVAPHMHPDRNRSPSFRQTVKAIKLLAAQKT